MLEGLPDNLRNAAIEFSEDIASAADMSDLGSLMMQFEIVLGHGEADEVKESQPDMHYLDELDQVWAFLCERAVRRADELGFDPTKTSLNEIEAALYDNYFSAAITAVAAARVSEAAKNLPLLAWAAFNKHSYTGYKDEIAVLRMLLWAGYNPNASDDSSQTALHYMASMKVYPHSHPRAVRLLLQADSNPNLCNIQGDTPMCYMCGNQQWTDELSLSFMMLLDNGADPLMKSKDGMNALLLLQKGETDDERKAALVVEIEQF